MKSFKSFLEEGADAGLKAKADKSGVSLSILRKVYNRGVAAWNSGHRPGTTPQQWGMARVNSYITKGKGTYHGADKDLREEQIDEESWESGYERRVVKTTKSEHKKRGYNWRIKGKERPEISIKLYKDKPSQEEFNNQMKRVAGHEFGESVLEDSRLDNDAYHKGVSASTARARVSHWKKMDKLSDKNPSAYEPAPGDATAKTKLSKHTLKYRKLYGEEHNKCGTPDCCGQCNEELIIEEAEYQGKKVKLNDPIRTSENPNKKFKVYVRNDQGNVVVVRFGDPNMEIKRDNPARRASFRARHNCDNPGPKWKAKYWSCMQWRAGAKVDN